MPPAPKIGRPSKLTPALQERIVRAVREGNYPETAAQAEGVDRATYYRWMDKGAKVAGGNDAASAKAEAEARPYRDFRDAVTRARATAQRKMLGYVAKAAPKDPENARWYLERTAPDLFGRRDKLVVENLVSQELDTFLARLEQRLPPETYELVLAALADDEARGGAADEAEGGSGRGDHPPQDPVH
jgi:transposase-like protein